MQTSRTSCIMVVVALVAAAAPGRLVAQTENPHGALRPGLDCLDCHQADRWTPLRTEPTFDHNRQSRFPLTGGHGVASCASCHADLRFDAPRVDANDCARCHQDVHDALLDEECAQCHTTTSFSQVDGVEVHLETFFPLTGAHLQVSCESCHQDARHGLFTTVDAECVSCHRPDYDQAHGSGFPTDCLGCHGTDTWFGATFEHAELANGFALLGVHDALPCEGCHAPGSYEPIFAAANDQNCIACHEIDFAEEHGGGGFPTTCVDCHGVDTWQGATFDHAQAGNGFALIGAHATLSCESCHAPGTFEPIFVASGDQDCYACHAQDYADEHGGSGYPTTCTDCHTADDWAAASFDHDAQFFPIYSGDHRGEWDTCETCHNQPSDFSFFTCLDCHEHRRQEADDEHKDVRDYVYDSAACLSCHPNGRE